MIVKDLSRFGRNYIDVGNYIEILYPSLGVRFISIQEGVDTKIGAGAEIMPISNVFNEWYAAQTSKKVRAVWQMKSARGGHVCAKPPYGYIKDPDNRDKWLPDPPAAAIVRRIYTECLSGRGCTQIARGLTADGVPTPTEYRLASGRPAGRPLAKDRKAWCCGTVWDILRNRVYTGCAVNLKTTTVSYKVHKRIEKPEESWSITPNAHPAIIEEAEWKLVQQLYYKKRRPQTPGGRKSMLSGILFCADCSAPLYLSACHDNAPRRDFFKCGNYASSGGSCTMHHIRRDYLEELVTAAVAELADFVVGYEALFRTLAAGGAREKTAAREAELRRSVQGKQRRLTQLDKLIEQLYEDRVLGRLRIDRFTKLCARYEAEAAELQAALAAEESELARADDSQAELEILIAALKEFKEAGQLTELQLHRIIRRIDIHEGEKYRPKTRQHLDIWFLGVGCFAVPNRRSIGQLLKRMEESAEIVS